MAKKSLKKPFIVFSHHVILTENEVSAYSPAHAADMIMCRHKAKNHQEPGIDRVMTREEENKLMASREGAT